MPHRLKSLEMQGYKTFANRTVFEFSGKVTAIVGPNGSGKSNIADSLRWVLGEQSFHLLRGKKTEDMIFSGSEMRPRSGMASATITFDNSDGWLPIDFGEVAITRRAYRDGTNEYLINGQRVRLKDVSELLAQSGLAERTYTIIGQGLVDAALALRAEDRRKLFEEAAGIGLYRARREEALRRLETTRRNLERVEDILAELEPRLRSLEKQAHRAQEYEQVKADLVVLLRDWYGFHWHRAQQELMEAREADRTQAAILEKARSEQSALDAAISEKRQEIQGVRSHLNEWLRQSTDYQIQRENLRRELAVVDERAHSLEQQERDLQDELTRLEDDAGLQVELIASVDQEVIRLSTDLEESRQQAEKARKKLAERQSERARIETQILEARQRSGRLNAQHGQLQARLAERTSQVERDQRALTVTSEAVQRTERDREEALSQADTAQLALGELETNVNQLEETLKRQQATTQDAEAKRKEILKNVEGAEAETGRLNARLDIIAQAEASLTGYNEGTRILLQAVRQNRLAGKPGALSQYLDVPVAFEQAIGAALGQFLESALLEVGDEDAFALLLEEGDGRAHFLPIAQIRPVTPLLPQHFKIEALTEAKDGWFGVASDLVQTTGELRQVVDVLLGSTWIVKDRQAAHQIINLISWSDQRTPGLRALRLATLRGEIFYASGPVVSTGKKIEEGGFNLLTRQRQRRELTDQIETLEIETVELRSQLVLVEEEINLAQDQLSQLTLELHKSKKSLELGSLAVRQAQLAVEQAERQHRWQQEQHKRLEDQISENNLDTQKVNEELLGLEESMHQAREVLRELTNALAGLILDEFQTELAHWNTRSAVFERALADERRRLQERQEAKEKLILLIHSQRGRLSNLSANRQSLKNEKQIAQEEEDRLGKEIQNLLEVIQPSEANLAALETQQAEFEANDAVARQVVSLADHRHAQTRIVLARRQETLQSLQRRIEEDFGLVAFEYAEQVSGQSPLPLNGMVEQLPKLKQLPNEIDEAIKRQRAQLRRIGPINPEAQTEYKSVKERYGFMTEQVADLKRAEEDIHQVIDELDGLMQRDFSKLFEAVAIEFKSIFQRLFGGGTARLVLTDPENLSDTGIDIEARLPGRRSQGLSLLSGGERSLTATSLVFALMKVAPTPFCVLDEVDAMLDEANVGRFRELLLELSDRTQFVIVTHNRNTVQAAEVIYGVTMGRDSVSQVVSLKLDQVGLVLE